MTIEKMCFVNPEDIKAIKISCVACGSSTLVSLGEATNLATIIERNCAVCGSATGFRRNTREWEELVLLGERLKQLPDTMKSRGITYSFRIECPTE
jgi:hypothetical protein